MYIPITYKRENNNEILQFPYLSCKIVYKIKIEQKDTFIFNYKLIHCTIYCIICDQKDVKEITVHTL